MKRRINIIITISCIAFVSCTNKIVNSIEKQNAGNLFTESHTTSNISLKDLIELSEKNALPFYGYQDKPVGKIFGFSKNPKTGSEQFYIRTLPNEIVVEKITWTSNSDGKLIKYKFNKGTQKLRCITIYDEGSRLGAGLGAIKILTSEDYKESKKMIKDCYKYFTLSST